MASMNLDELSEELFPKVGRKGGPPTIYLPADIDDDEDICQLMARNDEEVLNEWRRVSKGRMDDANRTVIIVTDEEGHSQYMTKLADGSLIEFRDPDGHLGGVVE
jgi:hypothetical protein